MPDALQIGESVKLTPEQVAQAQPDPAFETAKPVQPVQPTQPADPFPVGSRISLTPEQASEARKQTGQFDPLVDFTSDQLAELQTQNPDFNLVQAVAARPDVQQKIGMPQKFADAFNTLRQKGTFGAQLDIKKVPGQLFDIAKGFGKQAWNYAQALATPVGAGVAAATGASPDVVSGMFTQGQRQVAENIAGSEAGMSGLGNTISAGAKWLARRAGLSKPLDQLTPEERFANFNDALATAKAAKEISTGHGPLNTLGGQGLAEELKAAGVPVRPEQVQELAAGDPFSWELMGSLFHGAGSAIPAVASEKVGQAAAGLGNLAAKVGGQTIETAADVTKLGLDAASKVAPVAGAITGGLKGGALHGPAGLATGAALGYKGGQIASEGLLKAGKTAGNVSQIGEQIAGKTPIVSPLAQAGQDILQMAPAAAGDLAKGVGFDLALAGLTSEEAPEDRAGLGIGAAFGALGAGKRIGSRVLSGQIIAPRDYGTKTVTPSSGQFPVLDSMHADAIQNAAPGVVARLNAIRLFAKGAAPNADIFLAKDGPSMESALTQMGVNPEQAKAYSEQAGFFTTSLPGRDGSQRNVIVAQDVGAAPHEAFHAIQDVIGEDANRAVDKMVQEAYAPRWEQEGQDYARRLVGLDGLNGKDWREAILDASGWGKAEAADKLSMDVANRLRQATGAEPKPADVKALASGEWDQHVADALKRNPNLAPEDAQNTVWRDILNPQEAKDVGDRYLARELAAENFDAVFKHGVNGDPGLVSKLTRVVANVVSGLGGEPLAGRTSEIGNIPLNYDVTQGVKGVLPAVSVVPKTPGPKPVITPKTAGIPTTAEAQKQAADDARAIADAAPNVAPATPAGGAPLPTAKSPRELLGAIAEAIAARSGVKINYSSAPGEPAASMTSTRPIRRSIIEAFRTMPESARALWEKSFFPERVLKTKSGYQVLGWAPEVFAANAHKTAQTMIDLKVASPYELDPVKRSFTPQGWQDLYNDVATFVKNQASGRTGAGNELVVPKSATDAGFFAPAKAGPVEGLDQRKADFINLLFNFKLPETPRITSGKMPLNIAGQEVSQATQPGRVSVPVEPKAPFAGPAAEKLGIAGRNIMEVNPFRAELETAAKANGIPMPSLVEAVQRLDLDHIKEVAVAPELNQFRGNTLTLTAGFQPSAEPRGIKSAAVRDDKGKIYPGDSHAHATFAALMERRPGQKNQNLMDAGNVHPWATEGFVTNDGEFLNRSQAFKRAVEMDQYTPNAGQAKHLAEGGSPSLESTTFRHQQSLQERGYDRLASEPRFSDITQFQPKTQAGKDLEDRGFNISRASTGPDTLLYQVTDSKGKYIAHLRAGVGPTSAHVESVHVVSDYQKQGVAETLYREMATDLQAQGIKSLTGQIIHPAPAKIRAELFGPMKVHSTEEGAINADSTISSTAQFSPAAEGIDKLKDDAFWSTLKNYKGKLGGGITGYGFDIGAQAKSPEDLQAFRAAHETFSELAKDARAKKDYTSAFDLMSRAQVAREAYETATGKKIDGSEGAAGSMQNLQAKDPNFRPPLAEPRPVSQSTFSPAVTELESQFQPKIRNPEAEKLSDEYAKKLGLPKPVLTHNQPVPMDLIKALADNLEDTPHAPDDPVVKKAYETMFQEVTDQGNEILKAGIDVEPWPNKGEPYANSRAMVDDVVKNKHLFFLPTDTEFGAKGGLQNAAPDIQNNLLVKPSGMVLHGKELNVNEVLRFVHDYFGHTPEGNEFGPRGEYNALLTHMQMFSERAKRALLSELLMQSSWYFAGRHMRRPDGSLPVKGDPDFVPYDKRTFADPKNLLPSEDLFQRVQSAVDAIRSGQAQPKPGDEQPKDREQLAIAGTPQKNKRAEGALPPPQNEKRQADEPSMIPAPTLDATAQFAAKKDKEFKLKPAGSGFSKAWIFPDGAPVQIGGTWHNTWLDENPAVRKEFGFKTPPGSSDGDIRAEALRKGFARVSYDAKSGTLTFEGRETDWPTLAPSFEKLMQANLSQVDKVQVYQFNDRVDKIVDSGSADLFRLDTKKEKMAAIPFLSAPGEVTNLSPQATPGALSEQAAPGALPKRGTQFQPFAAKDFETEVEKIRKGLSGGQTFLPNGEIWNPKDKAVDIVSLASVNLPHGDLTAEAVRKALAPYMDLLQESGIAAGVFSFSKHGKPTVSIDVNAIVPQKYRDNTLEFAKDNDQRAIWDTQKGVEVATGGVGNTKLNSPNEILDAYDNLVAGKPVSVSDIQKQHRTPEEIARQQTFANIGGAEALPNNTIANMTKAELGAHFPEAVIARRRTQPISSDIVSSPLAKAAGSEQAAVDAFARKLVEFARENADRPEYKLGERWYRDFVPQLKKQFGKDATIFAELLAATSPNTGVTTNFGYAYDALQGLRSGRFKKLIPKFEEGLSKIADDSWKPWLAKEVKAGTAEGETPAAFLARWIDKYDLKPKQSNGSLYGQHSIPVLQVFARQWVDRNTGPKTRNFLQNLLGTGHDATIDVWADRTMRRLGYSGFADRWRILPENSTGVSDPDFYFSQKAFKAAAEQLGIKADDLQGALWFAEKKHWADNGWGRLDLGSFQKEMEKVPMLEQGIQQRLKTTKAKASAPKATPQDLFTVEPRKLK